MRQKPISLALALGVLALTLASPVLAQERGRPAERGRDPHGPGWADPADVLAAEIAFARLAQEKGQWTAFRATAARDAQQFAPGPVRVGEFLKGRKDPATALKWQPHAVWMACDGSYAVTRGAWQAGKAGGWFMTVWQRQPKGGYKWVLDQGDDLAQPLAAPEFLSALVAECPAREHGEERKPPKPAAEPGPRDYLNAHSDDGTLVWTNTLAPDGVRTGAHHVSVAMRTDGAMREVTAADVAPSG